MSQAANDLNFTFVVDENQGDRLVEQLHDLLIRPLPGDPVMGPTWEQLFAKPEAVAARAQPWWATKREALLGALAKRDSAYVYDLAQVDAAARVDRRHQVRWPRVVRAQGQSASGNPAHDRGRGARLRLRVAGRDRARARVRAGDFARIASCSRRTSRRAPSTSARSRWACTSPSTICSCCSTGSMPSRARACSCASTPASAAAITIM